MATSPPLMHPFMRMSMSSRNSLDDLSTLVGMSSYSNSSSSLSFYSSSSSSSDLDPFYLERFTAFFRQRGHRRTASAPSRLERAPFQTTLDSPTSVASEYEESRIRGEGREDHQDEEYSSLQVDSSSQTDSSSETDSNNPPDYSEEHRASSDHADTDLPLMASRSIYSDEQTGKASHSTLSPIPSAGLISRFSPASGQFFDENEHPSTSIPIPHVHEAGKARSLSSQEREFDEEVGRKGPKSINYLEEYAREQEKEAKERREAAEEEPVEPAPQHGLGTAVFAHLRQISKQNIEDVHYRGARVMQWLTQVSNAQEGGAGNDTNAAGALDEDPAKSSPSSSSSPPSDNSHHSTGPARGTHSNQYPHTNTNMAYQEGYAAGAEEGHRHGYRSGKKMGYDRACEDLAALRASEQQPQPLPPLTRANGAVITTEELTREVANMMDRLGIPYQGTGPERCNDEIRDFCNGVLLRLRTGEEAQETPASQENVLPQLKPKAQSESYDHNDDGSSHTNPCTL
ncbi:hypothetical protein F5X96DRAFT_688191 [Biscogniauxia mediterranea]|nr:hypothetical protein F5X96DRAFT_688191 [Biscogniauxia mediterranea]